MRVIRRHANRMHRLVNAIPPRPNCVFPAAANKPLGAWFAKTPGATTGACTNSPDVSLAFYMLYGECTAQLCTAWLCLMVLMQRLGPM
jgi:hypothetical protein